MDLLRYYKLKLWRVSLRLRKTAQILALGSTWISIKLGRFLFRTVARSTPYMHVWNWEDIQQDIYFYILSDQDSTRFIYIIVFTPGCHQAVSCISGPLGIDTQKSEVLYMIYSMQCYRPNLLFVCPSRDDVVRRCNPPEIDLPPAERKNRQE